MQKIHKKMITNREKRYTNITNIVIYSPQICMHTITILYITIQTIHKQVNTHKCKQNHTANKHTRIHTYMQRANTYAYIDQCI